MQKKFLLTLIAFLMLLFIFFVISAVIGTRSAKAPVQIPDEVERRVFNGPTSEPYVEGPSSPPPAN